MVQPTMISTAVMNMKSDATKFYSTKQEHMIASTLGWSVVSGSGAAAGHPGDISSDDWMGECKTHTSPGKKIVFYSAVWDKISEEAASKFKYPVLFVDDGSQTKGNTWCLFDYLPVQPTYCEVFPYPHAVRTNISFDSDKLRTYLKECTPVDESKCILSVTLNNKKLGICSLNTFANFFGDYK